MHEIDFFSHLLKDCFDILQVVPAKSVPNKLMHFLSIFRKNRQDIFYLEREMSAVLQQRVWMTTL